VRFDVLAAIYGLINQIEGKNTIIILERGLKPELAQQVAEQLMLHDELAAHVIDELGFTDVTRVRPLQAVLDSFFNRVIHV
jgi:hypothetical protein